MNAPPRPDDLPLMPKGLRTIDVAHKAPTARAVPEKTKRPAPVVRVKAPGKAQPAPAPTTAPPEMTPTRQEPGSVQGVGEPRVWPGQPWRIEQESPREARTRKGLRALLAVTLITLSLLGIRSLFVTAGSTPPPAPTVAPNDYPDEQAAGVAARFVTNYLTVAKADAGGKLRQAALAADIAAGITPMQGALTGEQQVLAAQPAGVNSVAGDLRKPATASVLALVSNTSGRTWLSLDVPLGWDGRRIVVTGDPAFVSLPSPEVAEIPDVTMNVDTALTERTRSGVEATLKAMAGADTAALTQLTAPGSTLAPIGTGIAFKSLDTWQLAQGDERGRTGRAVVRWTTPAGEVRQTYRTQMTSISTAERTEWRVLDLSVDATSSAL